MSDNRPIGIFDSGLGGLTVVKEIHHTLPHESIIYVGDTARVPYGNRSSATIEKFSHELVNFLDQQNVKAIIIACATASSVAYSSLKRAYTHLPIYGVINAPAQTASHNSPHHHYGVIGTNATINSHSFETAISQADPDAHIHTKSCPLFVPLIEEGILTGPVIDAVIDHYLSLLPKNLDTLILGCTHYPLIAPNIQAYFPHTTLINPGQSVAKALKYDLELSSISSNQSIGSITLYATDITPHFSQIVSQFLGESIPVNPLTLKT